MLGETFQGQRVSTLLNEASPASAAATGEEPEEEGIAYEELLAFLKGESAPHLAAGGEGVEVEGRKSANSTLRNLAAHPTVRSNEGWDFFSLGSWSIATRPSRRIGR